MNQKLIAWPDTTQGKCENMPFVICVKQPLYECKSLSCQTLKVLTHVHGYSSPLFQITTTNLKQSTYLSFLTVKVTYETHCRGNTGREEGKREWWRGDKGGQLPEIWGQCAARCHIITSGTGDFCHLHTWQILWPAAGDLLSLYREAWGQLRLNSLFVWSKHLIHSACQVTQEVLTPADLWGYLWYLLVIYFIYF